SLDLSFTSVTDGGLKPLTGMKHLRSLDISGTRVTDAGLKNLAAMKNLQSLNLMLTDMTDAGLIDLAGLKGLQSLNVAGTRVTDAGVNDLQQKLPKCKIASGPLVQSSTIRDHLTGAKYCPSAPSDDSQKNSLAQPVYPGG